jgi:phosphoribulokinase
VPAIDGDACGLELVEGGRERLLWISGDIDPAVAAGVEATIWDRMHFASHLRSDRLGEYTIGTQLHRSESLAIVQLLVLYHLVTARATVALGGSGSRVEDLARLSA